MASENLTESKLTVSAESKPQIKLFHPVLKDLLYLEKYCNYKIAFLSIENPLPVLYKKFTQLIPNYLIGLHLRREYRHLIMGIKGLKAKNCDVLFIFEAYNQHLLLLLPMLLLTNKRILIMLHGNQQFAIKSKIKYWGLLYLKTFLLISQKFQVLLLELDDDILPDKVRLPNNSKIIIPLPIVEELTPSLSLGERVNTQKIKIGIVGIIRSDKPIAKLIEKIQDYLKTNANAELIIGTPLKQKPDYLDKLNLTLRDTTTESDYFKTLQEIDILITHYDRDRYYYRASGVISDAGSAGCYIIASDYPVIKQQISYPVPIGDTFNDFTEIEAKIDQAIAFIQQQGQDNHWQWREKRTAKAIAETIFAKN